MKLATTILSLLLPVSVSAQTFQGMDPQQMQGMMKNIQQMQACMENIDQSELKTIEQQAKQMEAEVKQLCAAGKRDQALTKAMTYGKQISDNPALQAMKKCGEMVQGMMPQLAAIALSQAKDKSHRHICDS